MRPQSEEENPITHYVIVRDDEAMGGVGIIGAQIIHATNESCEGPLPEGSHAVLLRARDEDHLLQIAGRLWDAEVPHRVVYEPDEPFNGQATAIGIWPTRERDRIRRCVSDLPKFGKGWIRK